MKHLYDLVPDTAYGDQTAASRGGVRHLSAVLPALSSALGVPIATSVHHDPELLRLALGMPRAASVVVVVVDGLGYWNIAARIGHAPYFRHLLQDSRNQQPLASTAPSTTPIAMSVFGTGSCPGRTAMLGFTQLNPETGELAQMLKFIGALPPQRLQREATLFEALCARHVRVTSVGLPKFHRSPLTQAALRGADYVDAATIEAQMQIAADAAQQPGLTHVYIPDVDMAGHHHGLDSAQWVEAFEHVDEQLGLLHHLLPPRTLMLITADHGMIDAAPEQRIDIAQSSELMDGVSLVGGEPRMPMLYCEAGRDPRDIAYAWQEFLGGKARVMLADEAVQRGLYGAMSARASAMLGQIVVCARERVTLVDSRTQTPAAMHMPGVHGSCSYFESDIPCMLDVIA